MSTAPLDVKTFRVLLIEDNPADATLVREYLKEAHPVVFKLEKAKRMDEALEKLDSEKFDVILLDLSLPDSSGIQTFERVAKPARRTPIIVLTGMEDTETEAKLVTLGARDYLRKRHLEAKLLVAVLLHALGER
jgi:DNA-binding response OmpR family regulator